MPKQNLLQEIIRASAEQLRVQLRTKILQHAGELGRSREAAVREFLAHHLPTNLIVSTGMAFDTTERISKQLDVVIADPSFGGVYSAPGDIHMFRIGAVRAVGEVKSKISSRKELWDALEHLRSVSSLDRSSGGRALSTVTGIPINHYEIYTHRVFTFLIVAYPGLSGESARDVFADYAMRHDPYEWPNLIMFLDSHLITYCCNDGICPNTMHARGISLLPDDGLNTVRFFRLLADAVICTETAYSSHGSALTGLFPVENEHTIYSSVNDPEDPPFVSEWPCAGDPEYLRDQDDE